MRVASGVATVWTGVDMSTPLLLEVAPEIDTNPTSFYGGRGRAGGRSTSRPPVIGSCSALAMFVTPHILTWWRPREYLTQAYLHRRL